METLREFARWFSGGEHQYHSLWHCMQKDVPWVVLTVLLDIGIAAGYLIIAIHWGRNARFLPDSPAKRALGMMRLIFILCGICGYLFMPIKLFWPAWRLYDFVLAALLVYTWRYVISSQNLRVVYNELGRTSQLVAELKASQADVARRSAFLNAVSHDLRTPLNGLALRTELAEMQLAGGDTAALHTTLRDIKASNQSVAQLLDQLLDYARIDHANPAVTLAMSTFPLQALVEEIFADVRPEAEAKGLALSMEIPPQIELTTDRVKLRRILGNLIGNAIKYTPSHPANPQIRVGTDARQKHIEIHVVDHGIGIPADKHEEIFQEFFQVGNDSRDSGRGFGLGLPIARALATQLGGEIQLQSTPGRGSRFSVVLPDTLKGTTR